MRQSILISFLVLLRIIGFSQDSIKNENDILKTSRFKKGIYADQAKYSVNDNHHKLNFDQQDIYFIINNHEFVINEDTNYLLSFIKDHKSKVKISYNKNMGPLSIKYFPALQTKDTLTIAIPKGHFYLKRNLKIKINTNKGVDNWAYYILKSDDLSTLQYLNIKAVKPDGEVINIDNNQFLNTSYLFKNEPNNDNDTFKYIVPGLEAGDIIEIAYFSDYSQSNIFQMHGNLFFFANLPSLETKYTYVLPPSYKIKYKCYNNLKKPIIQKDSLSTIIEFSADSIDALTDFTNTCLSNELPYFNYSINYKDSETFDLFKIYNDFFLRANRPLNIRLQDADIRWIRQNLEAYNIKDKFLKFNLLYNKLFDNYEESNNTFGLTHKKGISKDYQMDIYVHILNYLKIDFYLCLAKPKYNGEIDLETARKEDFDYMLMFYDKDSNKVFVYPYEKNRKYYLNEFPEYLNGTNAILIKQKNKTEIKKNIMNSTNYKDSSELEIKWISLKTGDEKTNCFKRQYIIKANLNNKSSSCVTTFEYSGFCASQKRTDFNNMFKKDDIHKQYKIVNQTEFYCIETVNKLAEDNTSPFRYAIRTIGKINNMIDLANDSTITISINKLLTYCKVDHKKERNTNILLPSAYSDIQDLIIEFPVPIMVLNSDTLTKQIDNSFGTFKFDFLKSENNKIHINTTYIIKKELIPKNSFESLDSINNLTNYLLNTKIIVAITK